MGDMTMYLCRLCGQQSCVDAGEPAPLCCGTEMEHLPFLEAEVDPETARNYLEDEASDEGAEMGRKK